MAEVRLDNMDCSIPSPPIAFLSGSPHGRTWGHAGGKPDGSGLSTLVAGALHWGRDFSAAERVAIRGQLATGWPTLAHVAAGGQRRSRNATGENRVTR